MKNKIETISNLFEEKEIRSVWNSEEEEYYFSVVDVIGALTDNDYQKSRNYWKWLKNKLNEEGSELVSNTNQLKLKAQDGKMRETDVLDMKGIFRLIESVPSPKAEPMKMWLASLGKERIDEVFDPEIALTNIGEIATRDIAKIENPKGLDENMKVARRGGGIAKWARDIYEKETKHSAISSENNLDYKYVDEKLISNKTTNK